MGKTVAAQASGAGKEKTTEIILPSGKKFSKIPFKGKHIIAAQRLMDGDPDKYLFAITAVCGLVDGKKITIEELEEMDGRDVMEMIADFKDLFG